MATEIEQLRERLAKVEAALVDLLRAPYMEWYPYAIGNGCFLMSHPSRWPQGYKPKFKDESCVCGIRKEEA
jgi:hypothetical protein